MVHILSLEFGACTLKYQYFKVHVVRTLRCERGGKVLVNPYQDFDTVYVAVFRFFTGDPNIPILNTLRLFRTLLGQLVQCEPGCS